MEGTHMVPKGKRNTGKLAVIDKAYDLLENTYAWVANDKIIPNRHKYSIGKDILNLTLSLHNNLIFANNTKFNTLDDFLARRNLHSFYKLFIELFPKYRKIKNKEYTKLIVYSFYYSLSFIKHTPFFFNIT